MNRQQEIAMKNHCRFAFETGNPKLIHQTLVGSIVLSVNSGYQ